MLNKSIGILVLSFAVLSGCNKDSGTPSSASHGSDNIAMVNPGRIVNAMGWNLEMQKNAAAAEAEISKQVNARIAPARAVLDQKKAQIFADAKLTKDQIDAISNRPVTKPEMERMGLTTKQVDELFQAASVWAAELNKAQSIVQQAKAQHNGAIQNAFSETVTPVIRRVAKERGKVAVFQDGQGIPGIVYLDPSIDMTDAVISEIQKSPSVKLMLPDPPKIEWPATQPTTAPAAPTTASAVALPSAPTTQK